MLLCRSVFKMMSLLLCPGYMHEVLRVLRFRAFTTMPHMSAGVREDKNNPVIPCRPAATSSQCSCPGHMYEVPHVLHHGLATALSLHYGQAKQQPSALRFHRYLLQPHLHHGHGPTKAEFDHCCLQLPHLRHYPTTLLWLLLLLLLWLLLSEEFGG